MIEKFCNKQLLDELFEGMYIVDVNRTITFWNKAAEKITGLIRLRL